MKMKIMAIYTAKTDKTKLLGRFQDFHDSKIKIFREKQTEMKVSMAPTRIEVPSLNVRPHLCQ